MACAARICTLMNYFSLPFGEVRGSARFLESNGAAPTCHLSAGGGRVIRGEQREMGYLSQLHFSKSNDLFRKVMGSNEEIITSILEPFPHNPNKKNQTGN